MWKEMDEEGRRELITALYERITVTSDGIVKVDLTRDAQRHGAALALPETVALARPEGFERTVPTIEIEGVPELVEFLRAA
jgi:hypothetical protein